jgi:Tfp pilus assembly protein PilO
MFPKKKNVSPYITNIENSAVANDTIVKSLKIVTQGQNQQKTVAPDYTQLTKKGDLYELPIEVIIQTSSYERTIGFLKTLETLSRLTTVDKIQIKSDNNRNLEVTINIRIYVS